MSLPLPTWLWDRASAYHLDAFVYLAPETLRYDPVARAVSGGVRLQGAAYLKPHARGGGAFNATESGMAAQQLMGVLIGCDMFPPEADGRWLAPAGAAAARLADYPQNAVVRELRSAFGRVEGAPGALVPGAARILDRKRLPRDGAEDGAQGTVLSYRLEASIGDAVQHRHEGRLRVLTVDIHGVREPATEPAGAAVLGAGAG